VTGTLQHADELWALAGRLSRAANVRRMLFVAVDEVRRRLEGNAAAAFRRHRRSGRWELIARHGSAVGLGDAELITDPGTRDPLDALHRVARPLRPFGRLGGGLVVQRETPPFRRRDAEWLGRVSRVVSDEIVRRERAAWERTACRLYRKLAEGARSIDVVYHALDAIARVTTSDHSLSLIEGTGRGTVLAEKICRDGSGSSRIGSPATVDEPPSWIASPRHRLTSILTGGASGRYVLVVRASGGDPFDAGDEEALEVLIGPLRAALARD
jgi:hypothetical protein